MLIIHIFILISVIGLTSSTLVYPSFTSDNVFKGNVSVIMFYSNVLWNRDLIVHDVVLVDLLHDINIFNYCDVNQYTPNGVKALLQAHHINTTLGTKWAAMVTQPNIVPTCSKLMDLSWDDKYNLYYPVKLTLLLQHAG